MKKVEFLNAVKEGMSENAEVMEYIEKEFKAMEKTRSNSKAKRALKWQEENAELIASIKEVVSGVNEPMTASAIAELTDVSVAKISAVMKKLEDEFEVSEVKGKSGKVKGYKHI